MSEFNKKLWLFITLIFSVCLVMFTMSYFVTRPWFGISELGGDCLKNIYVYLYHSMYGKGYWFEGMNYPYGEHIVFADGFPLLSVFFATFRHVYPPAALSIMWWSIGISYVLAIIYLYLILVHFEVKPLIAMLFAGLIGIFSPQLLRFLGHYSLSLSCIIPMLFYWTLKYHTTPKLKYPVFIFVLGVIFSFIHPYFSAILLVWCLFYAISYLFIIRGNIIKKLKFITPILASAITVIVLFFIIMLKTDPAQDRPIQPYGTLEYVTNYWQIISSNYSPIWDSLKESKIITPTTEGGEGYVYIGFAAMIVLLLSLILGIFKIVRKQKSTLIVSVSYFSPVWLLMAFMVLLFGMGFPFIFNMAWLLKYFSIMRQFRSLGRFSWIFYYIITVYVVVIINSWFISLQKISQNCMACIMVIAFIYLWSYEASGYIKFSRTFAENSKIKYDKVFSVNSKNWETFLIENKCKRADFQALLILGFMHTGSDKYWVGESSAWVMSLGYIASLQLHIPIVDACLSRTSWAVTRKQLKIAAGPFVDKPLLLDAPSDKPYLLLKDDNDSLKPDERYLQQAAQYIGNFFGCSIYAFYPKRQLANDKKWKDSINKILPFMQRQDTIIGNQDAFYDHLDDGKAPETFFGSGAIPNPIIQSQQIAIIPVHPTGDGHLYEYSNWFLLDRSTYQSPIIELSMWDEANKKICSLGINTKTSVDNNGLWARASDYFIMPQNCRKIISRIVPSDIMAYTTVDEIMLRPAETIIISKSANGKILVNNHLFNAK